MYICFHLPKCAGTSLQRYLKPNPQVMLDYGNRINAYDEESLAFRRKKREAFAQHYKAGRIHQKIIYGHFYADQYHGLDDTFKYLTIIRDPIIALQSGWSQLQRIINNEEVGNFQKAKNRHPSTIEGQKIKCFDDYIEHPWFSNKYSQILNPLKVEDFTFIGIQEYYDISVDIYCDIIGIDPPKKLEKANSNPKGETQYNLDRDTLKKICTHHAADIEFYTKAKERFLKEEL
ncbi:hypothetical protein QGN29_02340 [Temperatibacter marinus]|uniref:Sulfotransferase family protein n=1 Tax=Temperatibacter marinus TaxID=1456591 RepID=A0AA52EJJ4_9PROT|nr:hypothetical protein [Temperatibacter marinus]WND03206.1 hypothetical protein QGN29_02340 [Temperatibacter marinus]